MEIRGSYTEEEWYTLQFAPLWTFTVVAAADEQLGSKEVEALVKELTEAHLYRDALAREVLMSVADEFQDVMERYKGDQRDVLAGLTDVAEVLDRKATPEAAEGFKKAMLLIGHSVARASAEDLSEGEDIREGEREALLLVAEALRLSLGTPPEEPA